MNPPSDISAYQRTLIEIDILHFWLVLTCTFCSSHSGCSYTVVFRKQAFQGVCTMQDIPDCEVNASLYFFTFQISPAWCEMKRGWAMTSSRLECENWPQLSLISSLRQPSKHPDIVKPRAQQSDKTDRERQKEMEGSERVRGNQNTYGKENEWGKNEERGEWKRAKEKEGVKGIAIKKIWE